MEHELSTLAAVRRLPRKFLQLTNRLMTLIAAEQTDRNAFLMEIDPLHCDVIVQRFETFTGKKAERSTAESETLVVDVEFAQ
jgi:hypothetical protein